MSKYIQNNTIKFCETVKLISKVALSDGSSQHGKALLASTGSNCVAAIHLNNLIVLKTYKQTHFSFPSTKYFDL